jgi:hypothetical protein
MLYLTQVQPLLFSNYCAYTHMPHAVTAVHIHAHLMHLPCRLLAVYFHVEAGRVLSMPSSSSVSHDRTSRILYIVQTARSMHSRRQV